VLRATVEHSMRNERNYGRLRTFGSRSQMRVFLAAAMKPAIALAPSSFTTPASTNSPVMPARLSSGLAAGK
jgi:hypothetical protein